MNTTDPNLFPEYNDKETQLFIFKSESKKAKNMIFGIAAVLFISEMLGMMMSSGAMTGELLAAALLFPMIFLGLGLLALKQPMSAIIISVVVFIAILVITYMVAGPRSLVSGLIAKGIIIFCLIGGFRNAKEAEKAKRGMA
jgi:hypothetical protein